VYNLAGLLNIDVFVMKNSSIYPNPASKEVTISLDEGLELEKVTIYTSLGQVVKTETNNVISVSSLPKGNYIFEIITNKGKASKKILVK
jgi:hypothetical protein